MLTIVEKVIFLQDVDIFEYTSTEDLAHIASITDEIDFKSDEAIYHENEISDATYMIIEGKVRLHKEEENIMIAEKKDVFGTWALFDDESRVTSATPLEETHLLKIDKEDFYDLLSDHINITQSLFKALVKKIRKLI